MLAKANAPLTPPQEAALNAILNAEIPGMRQTLQARVLALAEHVLAGAGDWSSVELITPASVATYDGSARFTLQEVRSAR